MEKGLMPTLARQKRFVSPPNAKYLHVIHLPLSRERPPPWRPSQDRVDVPHGVLLVGRRGMDPHATGAASATPVRPPYAQRLRRALSERVHV